MKSKFVVLGVIIAVALAPAWCYSSDWIIFIKDDKFVAYVDVQSISQAGSHVKAWFMWDYMETQKNTFYPFQDYKSSKTLNYFNCSARTSAGIQSVLYAGQVGTSNAVGQYQYDPSKIVFQDVVPDTQGEIMLDYVCAAYRAKQSSPVTPKSKR